MACWLGAMALGCEGPSTQLIELEASVEDGRVVFHWDDGSMNKLHVFRCAERCSCNADGTETTIGGGEFVWTAGGGSDGRPVLNPPLAYGTVLEGDVQALPLESGAKYLATIWLEDWESSASNIVAIGCDTFVAP